MEHFHYNDKYHYYLGARLFIIIILLSSLTLLYEYDPRETEWMPQCFFYKMTGLKCPGCGLQRAIHEILHGDLSAAWHYNHYLFIALPYISIVFIQPYLKHPLIFSKVALFFTNQYVAICFIIYTSLWWIMRNLYL